MTTKPESSRYEYLLESVLCSEMKLLLPCCLSPLPQDVVFIIRKNGSVEARTTLEAGPQAQGLPLTLLVDKGTASAAEVFAAAVR